MVLTRQQAKARGACAENHRDGDDCAVEPDRIQHDDGTQRQVLQARNTHTTHEDGGWGRLGHEPMSGASPSRADEIRSVTAS